MGGDVLSRDDSRALAQRAYKSMLTFAATPFLPYAERVADLSYVLIQRYVDQSIRSAKTQGCLFHDVENSWHVGLLHAVILGTNITFEDVMDVANMEVAGHVVSLTPDHRLPYPRRTQLLYNGLHAAADMLKLVKLAERTVCILTWLGLLQQQATLPHMRAQCNQLVNEMDLLERLLVPVRPQVAQSELTWCMEAVSVLSECARKPESRVVKLGELRAYPIAIPATRWLEQRGGRKRKS